MTDPITTALRLLSRFWLEEVTAADIETIAALPQLAEALPDMAPATLDELAVEYQRLFGFNLPPYESVFIDPSAMLMAPATELAQALYRRAGWTPPAETRAGAPDHVGLELLALADWIEAGQIGLADQLRARHLALWGPPFILTLRRLKPAPFYALLGNLTLDLILITLSPIISLSPADLFPTLPPPPIYRGSDEPPPLPEDNQDQEEPTSPRRRLLKQILTPREAGLFLTREDIARLGQTLDLPQVMGERYRMLDNLFRQAAQYDLLETLFDQLIQVLEDADQAYRYLTEEYSHWAPYAEAWGSRLHSTQTLCQEFRMMTAQKGN